MRHRVIGLFGANIATFAVVGVSFIAYSRLLTAPEFGLYAVALSATTFLSLILDGGLKTSVIKLERELSEEEESGIALTMLLVSLVLISILALAEHALLSSRAGIKHDLRFVVVFVGVALLFYPFVTLPTAKLERKLEYGHIAWIESGAMLLERAAPALFLLWTKAGVYSFVLALLLSRLFRCAVLSRFHAIKLAKFSSIGIIRGARLLREGGWIQAGTLSSVLRDNLHTVIIGPLFGKEWIGYYAWALQICLISSQIFAQISARVSLPVFARAATFEERWVKCLYQIKLLTIFTTPVLCGVWFVLPFVNDRFFHGKWSPALVLIPFLFLRMIPGLATTPLGPLLIVQRGGFAFARVNVFWTLAEIAGALGFTLLIGPTGLAWSYAIMVWIGLWLFVNSLHSRTARLSRQIAAELFRRPSLIFAACVFATLAAQAHFLRSHDIDVRLASASIVILVLCSYVAEPDMRRMFLHGRA